MLTQDSADLYHSIDASTAGPLTACDENVYFHNAKRVIDIVLAIFFLLLLSPIIILASLLILIDSRGPVIFKQKRIGSKRVVAGNDVQWLPYEFTCFKFRTMVTDADPSLHENYVKALIKKDQEQMDEVQGCKTDIQKLTNDPRVTRVGSFLRKSSIDELPQFFNVLLGEMSVVGPRPAIEYEVDEYDLWHMQRFKAKPGITGLWQVTGRCTTDFDGMVSLDIDYVEAQSLLMDFAIIIKTPLAVISSRGAA